MVGELTQRVPQQTLSFSTHRVTKTFTTKLQLRLRRIVTELKPHHRVLLEQIAYGRLLLQKSSTVSGAECPTENGTLLSVNGKNSTGAR
jgi:hypothetical protein